MISRKDLRFPSSMFQQMDGLFQEKNSSPSLEAFLNRLSVTEQEYRDPEFFFNGDHLVQMFHSMEISSALELPVLDVLRNSSASFLGLAALVGLSAPTFKMALDALLKFYPYYAPGLTVEFTEDGEESSIELGTSCDFDDTDYLLVEFAVGVSKLMADEIAHRPLPCSIEFAHGRKRAHKPDNFKEIYEDFFKCDIEFDCGRTRVFFPTALLHERLKNANEVTYRYAEVQLEKEITSREKINSLPETVKQKIVESLDNGTQLDLNSLAYDLHMSPRTLSRKLSKDNTSFKDLMNEVRIEKSKDLLRRTDLPVKCIAHKVGYQNSDSFSRAFKVQTGRSPASWKQSYTM